MSPSGAEVLRQIKSRIDEVDPAVVREQSSNGALVVDVREPEEWGTGHIPGAKHVPEVLPGVAHRGRRARPLPARRSCTASRATARRGRRGR